MGDFNMDLPNFDTCSLTQDFINMLRSYLTLPQILQPTTILKHYGIRGIANKWFKSYLTNREQFVTIGIIASEQKSVTCGLPQGSVLGPLLFLLYINDFNTAFSVLDLHLIADVSNLFYSK